MQKIIITLILSGLFYEKLSLAEDYAGVMTHISEVFAWGTKEDKVYGTRVRANPMPTGCDAMFIDGNGSGYNSQLSVAMAALVSGGLSYVQKRTDSEDVLADDGSVICHLNVITLRGSVPNP